ncbi:MAG: hypothetical protein ACYTEZ_01850 [Planctomycetota bacterium]
MARQRVLRRFHHRDLAGAAQLLGILKFFHFVGVCVLGVWIAATRHELWTSEGLYRLCLLGILLHGFFDLTARPVLWMTLAAAAQTLYVARAFLEGRLPLFGIWWLLFLWGGVVAAQQVERVLADFPQLRTVARREPWRTFRRILIPLAVLVFVLGLVGGFFGLIL